MSWYIGRINYSSNRLNENEFVDLDKSNVQDTITMCFTITNMHTEDDYERIKKQLLKLPGIMEVQPYYTPKKLCVNYDPNLIGLEHVVYEIAQLGYHYLNRG